jgi:hypothetical protein
VSVLSDIGSPPASNTSLFNEWLPTQKISLPRQGSPSVSEPPCLRGSSQSTAPVPYGSCPIGNSDVRPLPIENSPVVQAIPSTSDSQGRSYADQFYNEMISDIESLCSAYPQTRSSEPRFAGDMLATMPPTSGASQPPNTAAGHPYPLNGATGVRTASLTSVVFFTMMRSSFTWCSYCIVGTKRIST